MQTIEKTSNENYARKLFFLFSLLSVVLSLRDAPKKHSEETETGGAQAVIRGYGVPCPTVATALATRTKSDKSVANFVNSQQKKKSHTLNQGFKFELKLEKVGCFAELEKTTCQQKKSD